MTIFQKLGVEMCVFGKYQNEITDYNKDQSVILEMLKTRKLYDVVFSRLVLHSTLHKPGIFLQH